MGLNEAENDAEIIGNNAETVKKQRRNVEKTMWKQAKITHKIKRNGRGIPKPTSEFHAFFRILQVFY